MATEQYSCGVVNCDRTYDTVEQLRVHKEWFHAVYAAKCAFPFCGVECLSFTDFDAHTRAHYASAFCCPHPFCGLFFTTIDIAYEHSKTHYMFRNFAFGCLQCESKFEFYHELTTHVHTHIVESKTAASVVPRAADDAKETVSRMASSVIPKAVSDAKITSSIILETTDTDIQEAAIVAHAQNAKPYKCGECDISFENATSLAKHIRHRHNSRDVMKCRYCDVKYIRWIYLFNHYKLKHSDCVIPNHPNRYKYNCSTCNSPYANKTSLDKHTATVHP